MTDPLDRLTDALKAETPASRDDARARAMAAGLAAFDAAQENARDARPITDRPDAPRGPKWRISTMLKQMTGRPALMMTASVAVLAVGVIAVRDGGWPTMPRNDAVPPLVLVQEEAEADTVVSSTVAEPAPESLRARPQMAREAAPKVAGLPAPSPSVSADAGAQPYAALADNERFANADDAPLKATAEEPVSTFSVDVDTASWAYVRRSLEDGVLPPENAVRIEEMINYFPYDYAAPDGDAPFAVHVSQFATPWNPDTRLLRIGLQGELPPAAERPALNLVFLVDSSGSMNSADKLPLLKRAILMMLPNLRADDRVAIVAYAGSAGVVLDPTDATDTASIRAALGRISAGGSTAGGEGLEAAYALADQMAGEGRIGRVILATDGDFNVGISDPNALERYIEQKRKTGTYLSVLGFGRGNLNDAAMQALAQAGNGQAAYIDTAAEAQKVLVDQLTGALYPIAQDVKIQVEFNPAEIAEYRLIGYETRALNREDFNNDKVDAGEIGAGLQVTALYELTPVGSPAVRIDPSRYTAAAPAENARPGEAGFLRLRYKEPGEATSQLIETPFLTELGTPDADASFAAAIAGFGMVLRGSDHIGDWTAADAAALANAARGEDPFGYRAEAVRLMRLSASLNR